MGKKSTRDEQQRSKGIGSEPVGDDAVRQFVAERSDEARLVEEDGKLKVQCTLTGHEMQPDMKTLHQYWLGKALKRARQERAAAAYDFSQYEPHVVPHRTNAKKLFCLFTRMVLNRVPEQIERHVNGRRFKFHLAQWESQQKRNAERARAGADTDERLAGMVDTDDEEDGTVMSVSSAENEVDGRSPKGSNGLTLAPKKLNSKRGDERSRELLGPKKVGYSSHDEGSSAIIPISKPIDEPVVKGSKKRKAEQPKPIHSSRLAKASRKS
ncbi:Surfeit locus protein 2 [Porphyridium purpureum]|uniref:Surfeit locus protein 2 n=1 Tax=Porphyridium purpureum TaxID=35688 RepID=A0A5J4YP26_PORPP|nr:Surfeit locus protein 2 [Porphyridium purpureum]|eukprot:POR0906..scf295_9